MLAAPSVHTPAHGRAGMEIAGFAVKARARRETNAVLDGILVRLAANITESVTGWTVALNTIKPVSFEVLLDWY